MTKKKKKKNESTIQSNLKYTQRENSLIFNPIAVK